MRIKLKSKTVHHYSIASERCVESDRDFPRISVGDDHCGLLLLLDAAWVSASGDHAYGYKSAQRSVVVCAWQNESILSISSAYLRQRPPLTSGQ